MSMSDVPLTMAQVREFLRTQEVSAVRELVNDLADGFGVNLMTGGNLGFGSMAAAYGGSPGMFQPQPTWKLRLTSYDRNRKILAIKTIRELTACGLGDALDIINAIPRDFGTFENRSDVNAILPRLDAAGITYVVE